MPTTTRLPLMRHHSCSFVYFKSSGKFMGLSSLGGDSLLLRVERGLHDFGRDRATAYVDGKRRALGREAGRHVGEPDRDAETGRFRAAGDVADRFPVLEHGVAVARDAWLGEREADELLREARLLLLLQRLAPDEVALVQLHHPGQARLERRGGVVHVRPVEPVRHLEPKRIACAEAAGTYALGLACSHEHRPQLRTLLRGTEELEAVLAGVARAPDHPQ